MGAEPGQVGKPSTNCQSNPMPTAWDNARGHRVQRLLDIDNLDDRRIANAMQRDNGVPDGAILHLLRQVNRRLSRTGSRVAELVGGWVACPGRQENTDKAACLHANMTCKNPQCEQPMRTSRISSVVSESVARVLPCASSGSRPRVIRHCRAGCSPLQVQVSESVVSTGTATVSTGMAGRYLATSRAVEPPRVSTTINDACTCRRGRCGQKQTATAHSDVEANETQVGATNPRGKGECGVPCVLCGLQMRQATPAATWAPPRAS